MKRDITSTLSPKVKEQLDFLAQTLGEDAFLIQDTETTGTGALDQIHDFAALYYKNGRVYQIQYYVVQPNDIDSNGIIHTHFNEIKASNKGVAAFENMITDEQYKKLRLQMINKRIWDESDPMISRESLYDVLSREYGKVANFTYNAIFDIKMEQKLNSAVGNKFKFNEVYDVMTMSADLMPGFLSEEMEKELGRGKLEKVYKYLDKHYKTEFATFKTGAAGAQTHTAWDDVFRYTVPVLNFLVAELKKRGYDIHSYKNLQHYWNIDRMQNVQEIKDAGLLIGLNLKDYYVKNGKDYKWLEGTIGKQNLVALREIDIYNQMAKSSIDSMKVAVTQEQIAAKLEEDITKDNLAEERKYLRELEKKKQELDKVKFKDPNQRRMSKSVQEQINREREYITQLTKQARELEQKKEILTNERKKLSAINTKDFIDTAETKRLNKELAAAKNDQAKIEQAIDRYADSIMKKYKATPLDQNNRYLWSGKDGVMYIMVGGKKVSVPLPDWWGATQIQRQQTMKKIDDLNKKITASRLNPNQSQIDKATKNIKDYDKQIKELYKKIQISSDAIAKKLETKETILARQIHNLNTEVNKYLFQLKERKIDKLPPAYYSAVKRLEGKKKEMEKFTNYHTAVEKHRLEVLGVETGIAAAKERIDKIVKEPEYTKTIMYKGQVMQIGITQEGKMAYFLDKNGYLSKKVPSNIWDSKKGILKGSIQLPEYNPSKDHLLKISSKALMQNNALSQDMTITPIKMGLYTGITKAGKGYLIRAHDSQMLDAEEKLKLGTAKIYSVTEIASVLSPFFGREFSESWNTDFGTAHHRMLEAIHKKQLKLNSNGSVNPADLRAFIYKLWNKSKNAEDRADVRALYDDKNHFLKANFDLLCKTVNSTLKFERQLGIDATAQSEHTLGMQINVGGKVINISGTIDLFWVANNKIFLGDFKTSKEITPDYVIQMSAYRALLRLYQNSVLKGKRVAKHAKILLTPANMKKAGDLVDIETLNDTELATFIYEAVTALEEKNAFKKNELVHKIQEKWLPKLDTRISRRIVTEEVQTEDGLQERHFINGQSLSEIGKEIERRCPMSPQEQANFRTFKEAQRHGRYKNMTYVEFLETLGPQAMKAHKESIKKRHKAINNFINTLSDSKDKQLLRNLLYLRGEGTEFLYDNNIFNDYREVENPAMSGIARIDKNGNPHLNQRWVNQAAKEGFYRAPERSATFGGLTAKGWIRLFRSVDLDFLYYGVNPYDGKKVFDNGTITKTKGALIKQARKLGAEYTKAVETMIRVVMAAPDNFHSGEGSVEKAEEYYAFRSFIGKLEKEAEKVSDLPRDFLTQVGARYTKFLTDNPNVKDYGISQYVREHEDKFTKEHFNELMDAQAAYRMLSIAGMSSLVDLKNEFGNEQNETIKKSIDLYDRKYHGTDIETRMGKTEFQLNVAEQEEEAMNMLDGNWKVWYQTYDPERKETIIAQLGHRIARMLTRKALGDKVYKRIYEKSFKGKYTYDEFLTLLPREQRLEYQAAGALMNDFENARKQNKLGDFLLFMANKSALGGDEESKNLLALLKSIKEGAPELLTDSNIMLTIAEQVNGAKMAHYEKFDYNLIAELGIPLTMVGKKLDESVFRSPFSTYKRSTQELYNMLFNKEFEDFQEQFVKFVAKTRNAKDGGGKIEAFYAKVGIFLGKIQKMIPFAPEISEIILDFKHFTNKILSLNKDIADIKNGPIYRGRKEELQEYQADLKFALEARLLNVMKISKYLDLLSYFKENLLRLNDPNIINSINQRVEEVNLEFRKARQQETKEMHDALRKEAEEAGIMAKDNSTIQILNRILQVLESGNRQSASPEAVSGSGVAFNPIARAFDSREQEDAYSRAKQESALEKEMIKAEKDLAKARKSGEAVSPLEGAYTYIKGKYHQAQADNNRYADEQGWGDLMKKAREDTRNEIGPEVRALYAEVFSEYVGNELNARKAIDKITAEINKEGKAGHTQTVEYLNKSLAAAQQKLTLSEQQTKDFLSQNNFSKNDIEMFEGIRANRIQNAEDEKALETTRTLETERIAKEKEYLGLLDKEAKLKGELNDINKKLVDADPASLARLKLEKRLKNKEVNAAKFASQTAYDTYAATYGMEEDGTVLMANGQVLATPRAGIRDETRVQKAELTEAKRKKAINDYNELLKEQIDLYTKMNNQLLQAKRLRRKGDTASAEIVEAQAAETKGRLLTREQWAAQEAKLSKTFRGKFPANFVNFNDRVAMLDEQFKLQNSESDYEDMRQMKNSYIALKKQQTTLKDQLYRNYRKYNVTSGAKERGALDIQGELLGTDLTQVEEELAKYENIKEFAEMKGQLDAKFNDIQAKNIANANVAFKGENTLFGKIATSFKGMIYQFTQFGAAYKIIGAIKQGFSNIVASAKNLDKAMTDLRIVTGQTGEQAQETMSDFAKLAGQIGATTTEVASAGTAWLRQGYDMAQVTDLITSSLYLSRLGMISVDEATKDLTSSLKGFKLEAQDAMDVVDKLTALDVKAATTAGEIATGLSQFANLANLNGVSIDQAAAMVATIADVSQVSGAQAGNSLKMMLSRYGTVKSGKFDSMTEDGEQVSLNDVEKVLNRIGVSIRDSNLQFREFDEVLADIADKWDTLDNVSQSAVATALAGTRQREAFLVLMSNMDKYQSLTRVSENSEGTAARKYQSYTEQYEASQKRLAAAWEEIANSAEISKLLTTANNILTQLVKILPTIVKYLSRYIAMSQGYKLPKVLDNLGFFGPMKGALGFGKKAFGSIKNGRGLFGASRDSFNQKIDDYYNGEATGLWAQFAKPVQDLISALQHNTEALTKDTTAEQQGTSSDQQKIASQDKNSTVVQQSADATKENTDAVNQNTNSQGGKANVNANKNGMNKAIMAKAAGSVMAGITTAITSDSKQFDIFGTGDTDTKSGGLRLGSKIVTGAATGVATYFGGPLAGMLVSTLMDEVVNPFLLPLFEKQFDYDSYQLKYLEKASKAAEKNLEVLSTLQNTTKTLTALGKEDILIGESYNEAVKAFEELSGTIFSDQNTIDLWKQIADNTGLSFKSVRELKQTYLTGSRKEREAIAAALQAAIAWQAAREYAVSKGDDLYKYQLQARDAKKIASGWNAFTLSANGLFSSLTTGGATGNNGTYTGSAIAGVSPQIGVFHPDPVVNLVLGLIQGIQGSVNKNAIDTNSFADFIQKSGKYSGFLKTRDTTFDSGKSFGENVLTYLPLLFGIPALRTTSETYLDMSDQEIADAMSEYVDQLRDRAEKGKDVLDELEKYENQLKQLNAAIEQQKQIYDEINSKYAEAALLSATAANGMNLTVLGQRQLKNLGRDEIIKLIADEVEKQGGFMGYDRYSGGELSQEWYDYIMGALRGNANLWGVISGNSYTLSELLSPTSDAAKDVETQKAALQQFAAALGVSVEELHNLEDTFGNLTLAQVMASPEETRNSIGELTSIFTSMASSSGLTAENLEKIINQFPELIEYLGNAEKLANAMSSEIETLVKVYASNIAGDLLHNEGFFNQFIAKMRENNEGLYQSLMASDSKIFANATSFDDIIEMMYGNPETYGLTKEQQEELIKMVNESFNLEIENTVEKERVTTAMAYLSKMYERQIANLEQQKQALQEINKQREYENKLIEAKIKLEEAQQEKKRVWREGVGWVYESNQKAIEEAQKNLDEVSNEKKISELELQIQQLQSEKDYLDNLPNEEELKNMKEVYDGWAQQVGLFNESQAEVLQKIGQIYAGIEKISLGKYFEEYIKDKQATSEETEAKATQLLEDYLKLDKEYKEALNNGTDRTSQYFRDLESNRNNALSSYQNYVDQNKNYISTGWYDANEGHQQAAGDSASHYAKDVISINGNRFMIDSQPLSQSSDHYRYIEGDMKDDKSDSAAYWTTNNDHTATNDGPIYIKNSDFKDYYDKSLAKWAQEPTHQNTVVAGLKGTDEFAYIKNQQVYKMTQLRHGRLGGSGEPTLINEEGVEAIITPNGTITSLPASAGVVPADITRNVWKLGDYAPAILRALGYPDSLEFAGNANVNNTDAINIGNISMVVNADGNWDVNKFVEELKAKAALSKNIKR